VTGQQHARTKCNASMLVGRFQKNGKYFISCIRHYIYIVWLIAKGNIVNMSGRLSLTAQSTIAGKSTSDESKFHRFLFHLNF
jgi:hypothetical protein